MEIPYECGQERVVGVELNLAWAVEDEVVVVISAQFFFQPIHIFEEVPNEDFISLCSEDVFSVYMNKDSTHSLKAIHQTTVRPVLKLGHDIFETDEVTNVDCRLVFECVAVGSGIEVY